MQGMYRALQTTMDQIEAELEDMVAPSGSGKTATIVDLASRHFVIYCVYCVPSPMIPPGFKDPKFITLAKDVENIYVAVIDKELGSWRERVEIEFLARLLFLQFSSSTTRISKGASTIGKLVHKLQEYDNRTISAILGQVQTDIRGLLPRRLGVVIALDAAQVASNRISSDKLISPSGLIMKKNILFDNKGQIQPEFRRGFLNNMQATLVILGTALSLQDAEHFYSAIAKQTHFSRITDLPKFLRKTVLSDLLDMKDCAIPDAS
ncbi:hypothetical protein BGZ65_002413 [Modicella reniformis]|uniref:Uncharacterized protein n=1 Tax=Modicella reniformis TaxID=1440133 RepID=A0A9P6LSU3_9FUNG|nr:hypothetical protein BGZ65_002413 [Modicella reniformis]